MDVSEKKLPMDIVMDSIGWLAEDKEERWLLRWSASPSKLNHKSGNRSSQKEGPWFKFHWIDFKKQHSRIPFIHDLGRPSSCRVSRIRVKTPVGRQFLIWRSLLVCARLATFFYYHFSLVKNLPGKKITEIRLNKF